MNNESPQMHDVGVFQGYQQIPALTLIGKWLAWLIGQGTDEFPPDYFLPGQVVFHMEHRSSASAADILDALNKFLSGEQPEQTKSSKAERTGRHTSLAEGSNLEKPGSSFQGQPLKDKFKPLDQDSIITIPLEENGRVISIVPAQLMDAGMHGSELFDFIRSINDSLEGDGFGNDDILLRSGSPNWLMSATHHGGATGGPGGWPAEAHAPLNTAQWKPTVLIGQATSTGDNPLLPEDKAGDKVYVAILDTAPTQHALDTAYAEWRWQDHELLDELGRPNNRLFNLYPATDADFYTLHETINYSIRGHRYWARDHGLFIAGLIHGLAPRASLHLYEVLNPFGVGTLETIAQGLVKVLRNTQIKRPLIINCSFMLNLPDEESLTKRFRVNPPDPRVTNRMTTSIKKIFERLTKLEGVVVVAAAGNDSQQSARKPTCYPAAFKRVFGVGAMKNPGADARKEVATYSNLADDRNPDEGYMLFGGEPGEGRGILGVYIDDFPVWKRVEGFWTRLWRWFRLGGRPRSGLLPVRSGWLRLSDVEYERNTTGWAWWAGTSFAAALLTGTLAALRNPRQVLRNFEEAQKALDNLGSGQTATGERIIHATQER